VSDYSNIYEAEKQIGYFIAKRYNDAYNTLFYETLRAYICKKVLGFRNDHIKILDVGCGTGNLSKHFPKRLHNTSLLYGIDISADMLKVAKSNIPHLKSCVSTTEKLPFKSNSFNAVIGFSILHHLPNLKIFWMEADRVLRPNGFFIFGEPLESVLDSNVCLRRLIRLPFYLIYRIFKFKNRKKLMVFQDIPFHSLETEVHRHISMSELEESLKGFPLQYEIKRLGLISPYLGSVMFPDNLWERFIFKFIWGSEFLFEVFFKKMASELLIYGFSKK